MKRMFEYEMRSGVRREEILILRGIRPDVVRYMKDEHVLFLGRAPRKSKKRSRSDYLPRIAVRLPRVQNG